MIKLVVLVGVMASLVACLPGGSGGGSGGSLTDGGLDASTGPDDSGPGVTDDTDNVDQTDDAASLPDASRDPDGPEILDFSRAPERITEDGQVVLTVTITDPQGFDDIGGGRVLDEAGDSYGVFTGSGGTYSATLTWQQINNVSPINFEQAQQRVFIAEFFDSDNNRTKQPFSLELHCDGQSACDGTCAETRCTDACDTFNCEPGTCVASYRLNTEDHCGACGNVCTEGNTCIDGDCACGRETTRCGDACVDLSTNSEHCGQCDNMCPSGQACGGGTCAESVATGYPCTDASDCPGGECFESQYTTQKTCLVYCSEADGSCSTGSVCENLSFYELCFTPCSADADCPADMGCMNPRQETGEEMMPDRLVCFAASGS
jgi:hypothetical protein